MLQKSTIFLSWPQTHYTHIFNLQGLYDLKHKIYLYKTVSGVFHFWFRIKVYIF